jgi:hypothetical protein
MANSGDSPWSFGISFAMNSNGAGGPIMLQKHSSMGENNSVIYVIGFLIFVFGILFGNFLGMAQREKDAVKAGVAAWVADKDGNAQFQFKTE